MVYSLQKASMWKRAAAGMFDAILVLLLAVGISFLLSGLLGYNQHSDTLDRAYAEYGAEYGVTFDITQTEYEALPEETRQSYDAASRALNADEAVMYAYRMMLSLSLVIITLSALAAILVWEFFLPLLLGNGQTLGKKIFSLCLIRTDGVRVNNLQLFVRAVLGKFTVETMIPVYIVLMLFWGIMDVTGTLVLLALLIAQAVILGVTHTNSLIHDLLAGTTVADSATQMIFPSQEALIEYQKQVAAEQAARQTY